MSVDQRHRLEHTARLFEVNVLCARGDGHEQEKECESVDGTSAHHDGMGNAMAR